VIGIYPPKFVGKAGFGCFFTKVGFQIEFIYVFKPGKWFQILLKALLGYAFFGFRRRIPNTLAVKHLGLKRCGNKWRLVIEKG